MTDLQRVQLQIAFWFSSFSVGWIIAELLKRLF
jgi:hypothetical protein